MISRPLALAVIALQENPTRTVLLLILLGTAVRLIGLDEPASAVVFDEPSYVNAARLLSGNLAVERFQGLPLGVDPNYEHPPLGKVIMALAIVVGGDHPISWRMPSVVAGVAAVGLLYLLARHDDGDAWIAASAAALLAFDGLAFALSRTAVLDTMLVAFLLLGTLLYFRGQPLASGVACALASLVKLTGIYGFVALAAVEVIVARRSAVMRDRRIVSSNLLWLAGGFAVTWTIGLALLGTLTPFRGPLDHLRVMLDYGLSLSTDAMSAGPQSEPWVWLTGGGQMTYYESEGHRLVGAINPALVLLAPLAVIYSGWRGWRREQSVQLWSFLFVVIYLLSLSLLALVAHRVMYIHYMLPTIPPIAVSISTMLAHERVPSAIRWAFFLTYAFNFVTYIYIPFIL